MKKNKAPFEIYIPDIVECIDALIRSQTMDSDILNNLVYGKLYLEVSLAEEPDKKLLDELRTVGNTLPNLLDILMIRHNNFDAEDALNSVLKALNLTAIDNKPIVKEKIKTPVEEKITDESEIVNTIGKQSNNDESPESDDDKTIRVLGETPIEDTNNGKIDSNDEATGTQPRGNNESTENDIPIANGQSSDTPVPESKPQGSKTGDGKNQQGNKSNGGKPGKKYPDVNDVDNILRQNLQSKLVQPDLEDQTIPHVAEVFDTKVKGGPTKDNLSEQFLAEVREKVTRQQAIEARTNGKSEDISYRKENDN